MKLARHAGKRPEKPDSSGASERARRQAAIELDLQTRSYGEVQERDVSDMLHPSMKTLSHLARGYIPSTSHVLNVLSLPRHRDWYLTYTNKLADSLSQR